MCFFFDQVYEKDTHCNFLRLHLITKHGRKAGERQEFGEGDSGFFDVVFHASGNKNPLPVLSSLRSSDHAFLTFGSAYRRLPTLTETSIHRVFRLL